MEKKNKHPLYHIGIATFIALIILLSVKIIYDNNDTKAFWLFLIIALAATIFGMALLLYSYSRKLRVDSSKLKID